MSDRVKIYILVFLLLGIVNCASANQENQKHLSQQDRKMLLKERVESRWKAIKSSDFATQYKFLTPAKRKLYDYEQFKSGRGHSVKWKDVQISSINVSQDLASVVINASYELFLPGSVAFTMKNPLGSIEKIIGERWLWKNNDWWYAGSMPQSAINNENE